MVQGQELGGTEGWRASAAVPRSASRWRVRHANGPQGREASGGGAWQKLKDRPWEGQLPLWVQKGFFPAGFLVFISLMVLRLHV